MPENRENLNESIRSLRDSVEAAATAPGAIGRETEEWLRRQQRSREDMHDLLSDESIAAEMQVRDDVPRLLDHLLQALNPAT
jgi:hypothetical protein